MLNEYLITYEYQTDRIKSFDKRIDELASETEYEEKVKRLVCFLGVKIHTALFCLEETGDFQGVAKGNIYAAYLVPGRIQAATALTEVCKGQIGYKSKDLKARLYGVFKKEY